MTRSEASPWVVRGLYLFALILVISPVVDLVSTAWPPRPAELPWRYGFLGLAAGYLHTPMLGLVLASFVAFWQEHGGALRLLGVLAAAAAVLLAPVLVLWPLDVLQMRGLRTEDMQRGVMVGGLIQELKYAGAFLVLGALGLGTLATAKSTRRGAASPGIVSRARD